ncbi:unnamed protein product [Sphacelaria rigidula]
MVRPSHPDRVRAVLPPACESTTGVYREYPDSNGGCPEYASDVTHGCCTLNPQARDMAFLHIVRSVFVHSPIRMVNVPFSADFINWIMRLPMLWGGGHTPDNATIAINDERFDMIRAFVLRMVPHDSSFRLKVGVPTGHHVFRFPDNFGGRTKYVGLGTGGSTLDVSDFLLEVLRNHNDIPFMHNSKRVYSRLEIQTKNLVPVILHRVTLHRFLAQIVETITQIRGPHSSAEVVFNKGNIEQASVPDTHKPLYQLSGVPEAVSSANLLARLLSGRHSLTDIKVVHDPGDKEDPEEDPPRVRVTASVNAELTERRRTYNDERKYDECEMQVNVWPKISVYF